MEKIVRYPGRKREHGTELREMIKCLVDKKGRYLEATISQYWLKSESGKSYELWDYSKYYKKISQFRLIMRIASKNILWVIPRKDYPIKAKNDVIELSVIEMTRGE